MDYDFLNFIYYGLLTLQADYEDGNDQLVSEQLMSLRDIIKNRLDRMEEE